MHLTHLIAAGLLVAGVSAGASSQDQKSIDPPQSATRAMERHDATMHHEQRVERRVEHRTVRRDWRNAHDNGHHYGWRNHRRCWTQWRHHHRVRVCR